MLQKVSGGYYPSTTHRVVNPNPEENVERWTAPFFLHAAPSVVVDTKSGQTSLEYLHERLEEIGLMKK